MRPCGFYQTFLSRCLNGCAGVNRDRILRRSKKEEENSWVGLVVILVEAGNCTEAQ